MSSLGTCGTPMEDPMLASLASQRGKRAGLKEYPRNNDIPNMAKKPRQNKNTNLQIQEIEKFQQNKTKEIHTKTNN